jgi:hypothetical protein
MGDPSNGMVTQGMARPWPGGDRHWPPRIVDGGSAVPVEAEEQVDEQGDDAPMSTAVMASVAMPVSIPVTTAVEGTAVLSCGGVGEADLDWLDDGCGDRHGVGNAGARGRRAQWNGRQQCGQRETSRCAAPPLRGQSSTGGRAHRNVGHDRVLRCEMNRPCAMLRTDVARSG